MQNNCDTRTPIKALLPYCPYQKPCLGNLWKGSFYLTIIQEFLTNPASGLLTFLHILLYPKTTSFVYVHHVLTVSYLIY